MPRRSGSAAGSLVFAALLACASPSALSAAEAPYVVTVQDLGEIGSFFFSPDGGYFIHHTGKALQLWTKDGVLLREFDTEGYGRISEPGFLPGSDGFLVALSGTYERATLFRFGLSGERTELFKLPMTSGDIDLVRVFPDGRSCVVVPHMPEKDNPIGRYDLSGRSIMTYDPGPYRFHEGSVKNFRLAADGGHFAFSYKDEIYLYRGDSPDPPRTWKHPFDEKRYYALSVDWLAFGADGTTLLTDIVDTRIWTLDGELVSTLPVPEKNSLLGMLASAGILCGYQSSLDGSDAPDAVFYDISGKKISSFQLEDFETFGYNPLDLSFQASPDLERFILASYSQNRFVLYDKLGHAIVDRRSLSQPISVLRGERGTGKFWTATEHVVLQRDLSGAVGARLTDFNSDISAIYFRKCFGIGADNKTLVTVSDYQENRVQLHDPRDGGIMDEFKIPWSTADFRMSMDGRLMLTYGSTIVDLESRQARTVEVDFPFDQYPYYQIARALHPDSKTLIVSASAYEKPGLTRLYDFDGKRLREFPFGSPIIEVNPATGAFALVPYGSGDLELYDREGRKIAAHDQPYRIESLRFSDDGQRLAVLSRLYGSGGAIDILDGNGKTLREIRESGIVRDPTALEFLSGTPCLMVVNEGKLVLVNVETGDYATCLSDGAEWVIYTPDGYFDASMGAANFIYMVRGMEYYGIEQQAIQKNRPDIIMRALGAPDDDRLRYFEALSLKRRGKLGLGERAAADLRPPKAEILKWSSEGAALRMDFRLRSEAAELESYQVFVNDVALFPKGGKALNGRSAEGSETVALTDGENKVELSCRDRDGSESLRQIVRADYRAIGDDRPDLYYIGFGVSRYRDERLDLSYADKDVKDLGALFALMGHAFANIRQLVLTDEDCTVASIGKAKSFLDGAKPRDTLVLAIAGHGVHDHDEASTYYYLTHEARIEDLAASAAPFELVEDILDGVAPRTKLFLMDTCESGEVEETGLAEAAKLTTEQGAKARAVRMSRGLAVVGKAAEPVRTWLFDRDRYIYNPLNRRTGAIVFSSSKGGEFSYESDELGNGFFTFQILQALQGKVKGEEGLVGFDAMKAYVSGEVSKMSRGQQNPTVDRNNYFLKIGLPQAMLVPRHIGAVSDVLWSRNGEVLVTAGEDGNILVRDAEASRPPRALYGMADGMRCLALSPDGATIAAGYDDGRLILIDARDGAERLGLEGHRVRVASVDFSPDGRRLVSVDESAGGILVWDLDSGQRVLGILPESINAGSFLHASFSADGASLLAAGRSSTMKAFRIADGKAIRSFSGPTGQSGGSSSAAAYVPGDREIAAVWEDGNVYFWDARMGRRTRGISFKEEGRAIEIMRISADGRGLAGIGDGVLGFWDIPTGVMKWRFEGADFRLTDAAFSPDGGRILASGDDGSLRVLDAADGKELKRLDAIEN